MKPSEVSILPNRKAKIERLVADGYMLLGVTTQSGVGKGHLEHEDVALCLEATEDGLDTSIDAVYCPHYNFPVQCFCRKPQVGLGVQLIRQYHLNPGACIYVGDMKSDLTFATRCGFQFQWADDFFKE